MVALEDTQPAGSLAAACKTLDQAKAVLTFLDAASEKVHVASSCCAQGPQSIQCKVVWHVRTCEHSMRKWLRPASALAADFAHALAVHQASCKKPAAKACRCCARRWH